MRRGTVAPMTRDEQRDSRRDDRRQARRAQLLDDAIEAIRTIGPGATMEQLARRGGVTKPILYRHFHDRDGLIGAIAERFSAQLLGSVQDALTSSDEPRQLLDLTVDAYLAFIEREPGLYRFLVQQASSSGGLSQINPLIGNISRQVAVVVGEQLRQAGLDSGAAVPWAYGIVGLVHQAGDWWLEDRTMSREHLVGYLTNLLWAGLQSPASALAADRET